MQTRHRRSHRRIWLLLAVLLPAILLASLGLRLSAPDAAAPVRITAGP